MKLSTHARYGLRAMSYIARAGKEGKVVSLSAIAEETSTSKRYLEQIIFSLKTASMITGRSGKGGGYILTKPAEEITVGEIVQAAIGPINIVNCVNDEKSCIRAESCECRLLYILLNDLIVDCMNELTLADLAEKKTAEKLDRIRSRLPDEWVLCSSRRSREGCPLMPQAVPGYDYMI